MNGRNRLVFDRLPKALRGGPDGRLDLDGRPLWLPDEPGGHWELIDGLYIVPNLRHAIAGSGPSILPKIKLKQESQPRRGRQPLSSTDQRRVEYAAWLRDCGRWTIAAIGRALHPHIADSEARRSQARRDVRAGRASLHDRGVLPWHAWKDGRVADEWWTDPAFSEAVYRWQMQAIVNPSPKRPDHEAALIAAVWSQLRLAVRRAERGMIHPYARSHRLIEQQRRRVAVSILKAGPRWRYDDSS